MMWGICCVLFLEWGNEDDEEFVVIMDVVEVEL